MYNFQYIFSLIRWFKNIFVVSSICLESLHIICIANVCKLCKIILQFILMGFSAYPDRDPIISGTQEHYLPGDYITANCTSGQSNPAAELEWLINGAKVSLGTTCIRDE